MSELKDCWLAEHVRTDSFTWKKLISRLIKNKENRNFYFWWRLANEMFLHGNKNQIKVAKKIQYKLISKYNVDIELGAKIGKGLWIVHYSSIIITKTASIGENFTCFQGVTIGFAKNPYKIVIGNNVNMGAYSMILGGQVNIGNNVFIGAMSFVNKDIPDNCTVYTEKKNLIIKAHS
ncbi:serine acetyltransferase [Orbaceae bacterium ac157xtp]